MVIIDKPGADQHQKVAHFLPKRDIKFGTSIDFSVKCRYTELIYGVVSLHLNPMGFCFLRVKNR